MNLYLLILLVVCTVVGIVALVLHFKPTFRGWVAQGHARAEGDAGIRRLVDRTNDLAIRLLALANTYQPRDLIDVGAAEDAPNAEAGSNHRPHEAWRALHETFSRELHRPLEDLLRDLSREGIDVAALGAAIRAPSTPDDLRQMADTLLVVAFSFQQS